MRITPEKRRVH